VAGRTGEASEPVRLDKWLWAARLFKTRALAAEAVGGGRVDVNGARSKPGRVVRAGDRIEVSGVPLRRTYVVRVVSGTRGPAAAARELYEETAESAAAAERLADERRIARETGLLAERGRKPTGRDRRRFESQRAAARSKDADRRAGWRRDRGGGNDLDPEPDR
jgi:ribosome-associated heat shock protein Hsp15